MKTSRLACALLPLLALSCAESGGPASVDAQWNLTCPVGSDVECPGAPVETCLGEGGERSIQGSHGQISCTGDPIIVICEAVEDSEGARTVTLEANIASRFALELRGASINTSGTVEQTGCRVTIIENELPYEIAQMPSAFGNCGQESPSAAQPCQLSNVVVEGSDVAFELECDALISLTGQGYDVGAVRGGPTTIRFSNCTGF